VFFLFFTDLAFWHVDHFLGFLDVFFLVFFSAMVIYLGIS